MSNKIYVGNLSFAVNDEALAQIFAQYGTVSSARVISDRETGRSKGFGFVEMETPEARDAAIEALNGFNFEGRSLKVSEARPQEPRPSNGPRRDFGGGGRPRSGGGFGGGRPPRRDDRF